MSHNGLPEDMEYQDSGCPDLGIPECLRCPLAQCRYEMAPGKARATLDAARLAVLLKEGKTMDEAAAAMGVSRRTVYRLRRVYGQLGQGGGV